LSNAYRRKPEYHFRADVTLKTRRTTPGGCGGARFW
jgi:hypothetical protein